MPIKLIAIDMDGTLLPHSGELAEEDVAAIRDAARAGIQVVLASGRKIESVLPFYRQLGLDTPLITCNGAILSRPGQEPLEAYRVDPEAAAEVAVWARGQGLYIHAMIGDAFVFERFCPEQEAYGKFSGMEGRHAPGLAEAVAASAPEKLLMIGDMEAVNRARDELRARMGGRVSVFTSSPRYLEITHPLASKGQALRRLCARLALDPSEVMALGDAENDLDMIAFAGVGVAMGNATEQVKAAADFVTRAADQAGVGWAIREKAL